MPTSYGDKSLETLRSLVKTVDAELLKTPPSAELRTAWDELVLILSLGASPLLRTCPACNEIGMRAASRCSKCWATLAPLPA